MMNIPTTTTERMKSGAGLTMIEFITVIAMITIIGAITAPSFAAIRRGVGLSNAAQEIASALRVAQQKAISSQRQGMAGDPTDYGVHFTNDRYIVFSGDSFAAATSTVTHLLLEGITICPGSASDIVFNRLDGVPVSSGTVTIGIDCAGTTVRTITVAPSGTVQ